MNKKLLDYIKHLSKEDKKTLTAKALKTCEEVGELAKWTLPYDSAYATNHRFVERERILEESVDTILCALSVAYHLNFTDDEIEKMMYEKSAKWAGLQANEKDLKYPIPFEIHVTVRPTLIASGILYDVNRFKGVCEKVKVKPILLDLQTKTNTILNDVMTSSKHFGTNASAYEESQRIAIELNNAGYIIERVKIESAPFHPMAPKTPLDEMPKSCYFEAHIPVILLPTDKPFLEDLVNYFYETDLIELHLSKNAFKIHEDGKVTIMLTYRNADTWQPEFEGIIKYITDTISKLKNYSMLEIGKVHKEFSVYDTKVSHDNSWISS